MSWTRYVVLLLVVLGAASVVGQGPPGGPGGANRTPAHDWSADMAMKITEPFTLASVGDVIIVRPASQSTDPGVQGAIKLVRDADVGFGNFESLIRDENKFVGPLGGSMTGTREVAADLKAMGFTLMNRAGNHLMDAGVEGLFETTRLMEDVGLVYAGVGRNLIEHPSVSISCYLGRAARLANLDRHHTQMQVRFSSRLEGCPPGDMCIAVLARSGWHALGQRVGSLYFFVNKAYSQGSVTLRSADPAEEPLVDFRMLSDRRDLERLRAAFRFVADIAMAGELDGVRSTIFPTNYSDRVRKVSRPGLRNAMQMRVLAGMLGALPPLRSWLIDTLVTGGVTLADLLADDATLDAHLNKTVAGVWHPVGTCRMGTDPLAVTTPQGRVHGVQGLRVCDASVMPSIPCANTNITTIMVAERMADLIKQDAS